MGLTRFGAKSLEVALRKWGEDVEQKVADIVQETGRILEAQAKALAPVDEGNLRNSIEYEKLGPMTARVSVGAHYAIYIEFGTGIYAVGGDGRKTPWTYYSTKYDQFVTTRGMAAQPFWFPAVDVARDYYYTELRKIGR